MTKFVPPLRTAVAEPPACGARPPPPTLTSSNSPGTTAWREVTTAPDPPVAPDTPVAPAPTAVIPISVIPAGTVNGCGSANSPVCAYSNSSVSVAPHEGVLTAPTSAVAANEVPAIPATSRIIRFAIVTSARHENDLRYDGTARRPHSGRPCHPSDDPRYKRLSSASHQNPVSVSH
ncbi:MAG TPA: hypothetical protein DCQ04_01945 [Actinobacteria bacterium]|nr:hypothetical protein [Actinomycetota bacterium]